MKNKIAFLLIMVTFVTNVKQILLLVNVIGVLNATSMICVKNATKNNLGDTIKFSKSIKITKNHTKIKKYLK
jgi:hypothetical protein